MIGLLLPPIVVNIPYINNIFESIRRILKDLNITTRFRHHQILQNILVSAKDHTLPKRRTGVVHSITSGDCTATCVGQTKLSMTHHLKKHKRALTTYTMLQLLASAIAEHAMTTGHTINWTDTDILTIPTVDNIREMLLSTSDFS